jgi:hypothetical protein
VEYPHFDYTNRTFICTVVFVDIVRYSEKPVSQQLAMKARFNEIVSQTLRSIAQNERLMLDTGDGAALCFLGDPEDALFAANALREAVQSEGDSSLQLKLRIGINLGPAKMVKDINGQPNLIGDGINAAQRVMNFSEPDQILVSRSFFEVVSCLTPEYALLFHYLGLRRDKHVREHEIYEVGAPSAHQPDHVPRPLEAGSADVPSPTRGNSVEPETLAALEACLAKHMGPIAKIMIAKAVRRTTDLNELCAVLAEGIRGDVQKSTFLANVAEFASPIPRTPQRDLPKDVPGENAAEAVPLNGDETMEALAEQRLAHYIGPMARILVNKARKSTGTIDEFYQQLAAYIDNMQDRKAFLALLDQDR